MTSIVAPLHHRGLIFLIFPGIPPGSLRMNFGAFTIVLHFSEEDKLSPFYKIG